MWQNTHVNLDYSCAVDIWSFGVEVGSRERDSAHSPCQNVAVDTLAIPVNLNRDSTIESLGAGMCSA